jgi:hypothetical protein
MQQQIFILVFISAFQLQYIILLHHFSCSILYCCTISAAVYYTAAPSSAIPYTEANIYPFVFSLYCHCMLSSLSLFGSLQLRSLCIFPYQCMHMSTPYHFTRVYDTFHIASSLMHFHLNISYPSLPTTFNND